MKSSHVQIENNYFVNVYVYVFMNGRQRAKVRYGSLCAHTVFFYLTYCMKLSLCCSNVQWNILQALTGYVNTRLDTNPIIFRLNIVFSPFYYSRIKNSILVSRCMYVNCKILVTNIFLTEKFRFEQLHCMFVIFHTFSHTIFNLLFKGGDFIFTFLNIKLFLSLKLSIETFCIQQKEV